jgi:BolA protein
MSTAAEQAPRRQAEIRRRLEARFGTITLEVIDESHQHIGHAGSRDGRGHFRLRIVAAEFAGLPLLRRHRMVYEALGDLMTTDVHALAIEARAPGED